MLDNINNNGNNKKILYSISISILLISLNTINLAFGLNEEINNNTVINNKNNIDKNINSNITKSNINNNLVNIGADRRVYEGDLISITGLIANAISLPAHSVIYSWNQTEGPKIDLSDEEKQNKNLKFIAPNRPNDTKYVFELNAIQKNSPNNIELGKDSVTVIVMDINKIAKGAIQPNVQNVPPDNQNVPPDNP